MPLASPPPTSAPPKSIPAGRERVRDALAVAAVVALGLFSYSNALGGAFVFDDVRQIRDNPIIRDLGSFLPGRYAGLPNRYVAYLTFALNYRLGGLATAGYHLVNVVIHVANALLVYALVRLTFRTPRLKASALARSSRAIAAVAAALFVAHPLQTQAVSYVAQRLTSLATTFYVGTVVLYAALRLGDGALRSRWRAVAGGVAVVATALLAMKTKEIAFTLPAVAAAWDLFLFRPGRRLLLLIPLAVTALLVPLGVAGDGGTLSGVLDDMGRLAAETPNIPRSVYALTQTRVVATYLRMLVLPLGQNVDHDVRLSTSLADPAVLGATAVLVFLVAGAVVLLVRARRTHRAEGVLVAIGVAWFFITLSVESSIIPIRDVMAEHRTYLPLAGVALALATALLTAAERIPAPVTQVLRLTLALLVTTGPLAVATYARNRVWDDDVSLWRDAVDKSPVKARPRVNLGAAHGNRGELDAAAREYEQAVRIAPDLAEARRNLGGTYFKLGRIDEAIREYHEVVSLKPGWAEAHSSLGAAYEAKGQRDDAIREYRDAIRLDPALVDAHANLGAASIANGRLDDAAAAYREAIRLAPDRADAHFGLGFILAQRGRPADAIVPYARAAELRPSLEYALNLAVALDDAGRAREAIAWFERYLELAGGRETERAEQVRARLAQIRALPTRR